MCPGRVPVRVAPIQLVLFTPPKYGLATYSSSGWLDPATLWLCGPDKTNQSLPTWALRSSVSWRRRWSLQDVYVYKWWYWHHSHAIHLQRYTASAQKRERHQKGNWFKGFRRIRKLVMHCHWGQTLGGLLSYNGLYGELSGFKYMKG